MWDEIVKYLPQFSSAVLTSVDGEGYPVSVRCHPQPDSAAQVLRIGVPAGIGMRLGPAALLCHSVDEKLWDLKSFAVRGTLEQDGNDWIFRPTHFVPGFGLEPGDTERMTVEAQSAATRYLEKRGLSRPVVPWDKFKALRARGNT